LHLFKELSIGEMFDFINKQINPLK
jgi:hypothetical protein